MIAQDGSRPGVPAGWTSDGPLGAGGMSTLWKAHRDGSPPVRVVIKRASPEGASALRREIALLSTLQHGNVVHLVEAGDDGAPWAALALVPGRDLAEVMADGPVSPMVALDLFVQLVDALAFLHARGVSHCDVKPRNVMVTRDDRIVLVDFGAAVRAGEATRPRLATSASWAPPEVTAAGVDTERWDVYSAGVVLYEMLTGTTAFPSPESGDPIADAVAVLMGKAAAEPLDPGPGAAEPVRDLVRRMTDPDPKRRPESALALVREVRDLEVPGWLPIELDQRGASVTWPEADEPRPASGASTFPMIERTVAPAAGDPRIAWLVTAGSMLVLAGLAITGLVAVVAAKAALGSPLWAWVAHR